MKKGVILFVFLIALLISITAQTNIDINNLNDKERLVYDYGSEKFDEFAEKSPGFREAILDDPRKVELFLTAIEKSGKKDEFYKLWTERHEKGEFEGKYKLGNDVKNKIWEYLSKDKEKANEHIKNIAKKLFERDYSDVKWDDSIKRGIEKVNIDNPEKLTWEGNKLILKENEKSKVWVDFENLPNWLKEIEFKDNKFKFTLDTSKGKWFLNFDKGSVDYLLRPISPEGKTIGIHTKEGIKSISFKKAKNQKLLEEVTIEYFDEGKTKSDGSPETKKLVLKKSKLNEKILEKFESILDSDKDGQITKFLENLETDVAIDFLSEETRKKMGLDTENILSFALENPNGAEISLSYDEKMNPVIKTSKDAAFTTFNSRLDQKITYTQLDKSKESNFHFDRIGDLREVENANIESVGYATVSVKEKTGFRITESTLADALAKGDGKAALEYILLDKPDIVNKLGGDINKLDDVIAIIEKELNNPRLGIEVKRNLEAIQKKLAEEIGKNVNLVIESAFKSGDLSKYVKDEKFIKNALEEITKRNLKKTLEEFYSNPEKLQILLENDLKAANEIYGELTTNLIDDKEVQNILSAVNRNFDIDIKPIIEKTVNNLDFNKLIYGGRDEKINHLVDVFSQSKKLNEDEIKKIRERLNSGLEIAESEVRKLKSEIPIKDIFFDKEYQGPNVFMDLNSRTIAVKGDGILVNTKTPLNKFSVDNEKATEGVNLFSNGNLVAQFNGDKTYFSRVNTKGSYYKIDKIENTKNPNKIARLETTNGYGQQWIMSYPGEIKERKMGSVIATGVPALGYYHAVDMQLISPDPAVTDPAVEGAKISVYNYAAYGTGDPNLQRALAIGAAEGRSRVPGLVNFFTLGIAGRYAENRGTEIAFQQFMQSQDPGKSAGKLAGDIRTGYNKARADIYKVAGGKETYEYSAGKILSNDKFPEPMKDRLYSSLNEKEFMKIPDFLERNPTPILTITPTSITTYDGKRLDNINPRIMRDFFRGFAGQIKHRQIPYR